MNYIISILPTAHTRELSNPNDIIAVVKETSNQKGSEELQVMATYSTLKSLTLSETCCTWHSNLTLLFFYYYYYYIFLLQFHIN